MLKYFGYSGLFTYTCATIKDYINGEKNCKSLLLAYGCTSPGLNCNLFIDKYRLKVVNIKHSRFQLEVFKKS